ncbi:hypothetical protein IL306_013734 [Fusarium sp. DS 682]|nr:hypothetical protein IL306_013734 [Fusarium sp. DS 682]
MTELDPSLYHVAWIAPLEIEAQAALHMLDTKHRRKFPVGRGDDYIFHAGTMSGHNIIIATLPAGQHYGTGSAAALAGQERDILYEVFSYGLQKEMQRERRPEDQRTRIWYGPIGSGDKLMRNAYRRNELRDKFNIIGLEMEAAGTMNHIPVGVIRGVCDYGDEHKSKEWQPYAAAMAAAYGKALLSEILTNTSQRPTENSVHIASVTESRNENKSRFRGIFYIDASNNVSANSSYLDISRLCGLKIDSQSMTQDEQVRFTRSWISCQTDPWLLMIDNANSSDVALAKYVPTVGPGTIILTTTDENLTLWGSFYAKLGCMGAEDSLNLLLKFKREELTLGTEQEDAAKRLAADILGGLPLAIAQAGTYIFNKRCTYTEYCEELCESPQGPLSYQLTQCPSYGQPVWTAFDLTLSRIQGAHDHELSQALDLLGTLCFLHHEGVRHDLFEEAWKNMKLVPAWSSKQPFRSFVAIIY